SDIVSECHGHTLHLPPLPTRRSSDLLLGVQTGLGEEGVEVDAELAQVAVLLGQEACDGPVAEPGAALGGLHGAQAVAGLGVGIRSEEHTSELQSRENLVCRLLLEKKN